MRDRLNIKSKDRILLSVINVTGSGTDGKITLLLAKAPENSSGLAFSKNGSFLSASAKKKKEISFYRGVDE